MNTFSQTLHRLYLLRELVAHEDYALALLDRVVNILEDEAITDDVKVVRSLSLLSNLISASYSSDALFTLSSIVKNLADIGYHEIFK